MTPKMFVLIFILWFTTMAFLALPAHGAEVGLVTNEAPITCLQAELDFNATGARWTSVKRLRDASKDPHDNLALDAELKALSSLGGKIMMWKAENCKKS